MMNSWVGGMLRLNTPLPLSRGELMPPNPQRGDLKKLNIEIQTNQIPLLRGVGVCNSQINKETI